MADVASLDRRRQYAAEQRVRFCDGYESQRPPVAALSPCRHVCDLELHLGVHVCFFALFAGRCVHPGLRSLLGFYWTHAKSNAVR